MNRLVVQKYGGSVLIDEEAFSRAAGQVARTVQEGFRVLAVVSALAGTTDRLLAGAKRVNPHSASESMDLLLATGELQSAALLALALAKLGIRGIALNPWQLGVHTDGKHGDAKITRINPLPLKAELYERPVVVVPGFLGRGEGDCLTTLGRGGSDLSAVALSDALEADRCEFFKDVPGYFSADPHLVPSAVHRPCVTGKEAMELSRFGCRFLQDRAISWAMKSRCRVLLRALDEGKRATVLLEDAPSNHPAVLALTHCRTPAAFSKRIPRKLGKETSLLSVVGTDLAETGEIDAGWRDLLARNNVDSFLLDRSPIRLTLAVRSKDLPRAQQEVHHQLFGSPDQSTTAAATALPREEPTGKTQ